MANRSVQGDGPHGKDHENPRLYTEDLTAMGKTYPLVSGAPTDYGGTVGLGSGHGGG